MAKFPERSNNVEESSSWLYTALGMGIILCVVGFIGLAQPSGPKSTPEPVIDESGIPKFQAVEKSKVETPVVKEETVPAAKVVELVKVIEPIQKAAPKQVELPGFPANVLEDTGLFVSLPFGGDAREKCSANCNSEVACLQSCGRLSPSDFARRILPKELDHKALAAKSIESCANASFLNPITGGHRAELKTLLSPVEFYEESEVSKKIMDTAGAMQNLTNTGQTDPLAEAVCYYEGSLVSALAAAKAAKNKDSISELAYREYETSFANQLQRKLQEIH